MSNDVTHEPPIGALRKGLSFRTASLIVGPDNPLIRTSQYLASKSWLGLPQMNEIHLTDLVDFGALSRTHLVSVEARDPGEFVFDLYGPATAAALAKDHASLRLTAIEDQPYRSFVIESYKAVRDHQSPSLVEIDLLLPILEARYKRPLYPLGHNGSVTHVLSVSVLTEPE